MTPEIANIPYSKILSVNPDIKDRWVKLSRKQKFTVYLPKGTLITNVMKKSQYKVARAPKVKKTKSKVRHSRKTFKHKVASGQNLYMIAKKYKTTVARLKRTNRLRSSKLHVGQKLKVPNVVSKVYVVKKGDNLSIIAEKFNTSIGKIVMANSLKSKRIFPKQKIEVPIKIGQI